MNDFAELVKAARTCRRFYEDKPVSAATLRQLVDCARITSSCANRLPVRYITLTDPALRSEFFPHTKWAGALKDWDGPAEGERPTGYILICSVTPPGMFVYYDTAIAAQTMQLHAWTIGVGCCMINTFSRDEARKIFGVPDGVEPMLVLAFGAPKEERRLVDKVPGDDRAYWRDAQGVHYVPKHPLDTVLLAEK